MTVFRNHLTALASVLACLVVAGCSDHDPVSSSREPKLASKIITPSIGTPILPGNWIVVLQDDIQNVDAVVEDLHTLCEFDVTHTYRYVFKGFAASVRCKDVAILAADPRVMLVEPVIEMTVDVQTVDWGIRAIGADNSSALSGNGSGVVTGVEIYILDTGCDMDHTDLNVNATLARNYTTDASTEDGHGHGTHCAGIVAALDNTSFNVGVVPGAPIIPLKVLSNSGSGYNSWIISGLDYVVQRKQANPTIPMVASMSLGGDVSTTLDRAVNSAVDEGVVAAVAAGNDNEDAMNHSPARAADAITVGAHGSNNTRASFSNYGRRVDIFAPGVSIYSTYKNGGAATMSGTSMACPYVAGCAALLLSNPANASMSPLAVRNQLVYDAKAVVTSGLAKTTNRSVYVGTY